MIGLVMAAAVVGASFLVGGGSSSGPTGVNIRTLAVGSVAPTFSGTDALTSTAIDASTLAGENVLYFFNSGSTCQACMVEAQALQEDNSLFKKADITLVMVTNDSVPALVAAARVDKLTIPMVADPTGALTRRFGAVGGGMNMGANTADHSFILVDKSGVVRFHQDFPSMWISPVALFNEISRMT
jgi:peroxiredoxin